MENLEFQSRLKIKNPLDSQPTLKNISRLVDRTIQFPSVQLPEAVKTTSVLAKAFNKDIKYDKVFLSFPAVPSYNVISNSKYFFVADQASPYIYVMSYETRTIVEVITLPNGQASVIGLQVVDNFLFVASDNDLYKIDTNNFSITATTSVLARYYCGAIMYDGEFLWVPNTADNLTYYFTKYDLDLNAIASSPTASSPGGSAKHPWYFEFDGVNIWFFNEILGSDIIKLNTQTNTFDATIPHTLPNWPSGITFDGQYIWISDNSGNLKRLDIHSNAIISAYSHGSSIYRP